MTFYQELQLNQAGSKSLLKNSKTMKEKLYHTFVYMVKIAVTMVFCFAFVTASSIILGKDNSIVGVVVLLCVMVFRNADLGIHTVHSTCNMPRAMWAGIAAMSAILPFMEDMQYRVKKRIVGNIAGVICFTVLYFLLPPSIYAYIGIIGGIGVGLSAQYGWQAVFNTFGALAIAAESYGLKGAVSLRVIQNVFGVVFALVFCAVFYRIMSVKVSVKEKAV